MNRSSMAIALLLALAGAPLARAQYQGDEVLADEDAYATPAARAPGGPTTLQEAATSGRSLRIGGWTSPRNLPEAYTVRSGDTLWDITGRFFGNPWEWPRLWSFNPEVTNPHWIYPLDTLRLLPAGQRAVQLPSRSFQVAGNNVEMSPGSIYLRDEGYLDREALEHAATIVGSPVEHMLLSPPDQIYLRVENPSAVRPGTDFTIFQEFDLQARGNDETGQLVGIVGTARVVSYDRDRNLLLATLIEAQDPIERGLTAAPIERRFEVVPIVTNTAEIRSAPIMAALRPQRLLGDQQLIFIGAGSAQGVQEGNRFQVIRHVDEWQVALENAEVHRSTVGAEIEAGPAVARNLPDEVIAEVRVVRVRRDYCIGMITRAVREISIQDTAELRRGY